MARQRTAPTAPNPQADDVAAVELEIEADAAPPAVDAVRVPDEDPRDVEIAALKAELKKAKAAAAGPQFEPGQRFLVTLKDAPSWVVEPQPGEHPFEAYKRATGCTGSVNTPEITPTAKPVGRVA